MQESLFRIYFVWPDAARHEYGPRERKCKLPAHRDTVTLDKPEEEKQGPFSGGPGRESLEGF